MTDNLNAATYFVTLTPAGRFAFGDAPQGEYGNRQNYFLRSNLFPQQTGILGFVRHQLLLQNNLLFEGQSGIYKQKKSDADVLIGSKGFSEREETYGVIQKISPVFMYDGVQYYFVRDKEICEGNAVRYNESTKTLDNYFVKKDFDFLFYGNKGCKKTMNDIFIEQYQAGIRMVNKQVAENAYYRQKSYKLKKGFSFGFYLTLESKKVYNFNSGFTYFGKERSLFKMEVTLRNHSEHFESEVYNSQSGSNKFLCISDVMADNNFLNNCQLVLAASIPFQYRITANDTANHHDKPDMSCNSYILKRGSVIYASGDHIKTLREKTSFYNIGYNHLVPVKNNLLA